MTTQLNMKTPNILTKLCSLTALVLFSTLSYGQYSYKEYNQHDRYRGNYPWKVNVQMSMIDTNYSPSDPTSFNELNAASLPRVSVEYSTQSNFGFKLGIVNNKIKEGQIVSGRKALEEFNVTSIDAAVLYSLGGLINIPVVDPYIETGFGYMDFNGEGKGTYNLGGGVNIWLADTGFFGTGQYNRDLLINRFGLNLSAMGKKNLSDGPGSYLELSAGVFFVF